ncbi:MAG: S8 family serine peptidase [Saprospiraceae bacterium]|nr:S8 family serine peptidase [Saprospiraceae bacterium]
MKNKILLSLFSSLKSYIYIYIYIYDFKYKLVLGLLLFLIKTITLDAQCTNPPAYNDPGCSLFFPNNAFNLMNIPCAWTVTNGDQNVVVAIFDGYFDTDHIDLVGKIENIYYSEDCAPNEDATWTHGTASMGAIAAIRNNGECVAGAGGDIRVAGFCRFTTGDGVLEAVKLGYKIIYLATGLQLDAAVAQECVDKGATIILANRGGNVWSGLDNIPGVIKVGLTYGDGTFDHYLNSDPLEDDIDVFAVGSYDAGGSCALRNGNTCGEAHGSTSLSAGFVAGVVGLMRSVNPCLTPAEIENILEATAGPLPLQPNGDPLPQGVAEHGIINAYDAVLMAQNLPVVDEVWTANGQTITNQLHVTGNLNLMNQTAPNFKTITLESSLYLDNNKNLIVNSGVHFIVNGYIFMGENGKIIVKRGAKLEIGGELEKLVTLSNNPCSSDWEGIIIEGNSGIPQPALDLNTYAMQNAGILIVNNALIQNAKNAISMNPSHIPWPNSDFYGGYLAANNVQFINNRRSVEFMRYNFNDESSISNCEFFGEIGTSHWGNYGVTYSNNTFNTSKFGIFTIDASLNAENCVFNGDLFDQEDYNGITLQYTSIGSTPDQSNISSNQFIGGRKGIEKIGGDLTDSLLAAIIKDNIFLGQYKAVALDGLGSSLIDNNDFTGNTWGNYITRLGGNLNLAQRNDYSSYDFGISAYADCSGFNFINNCFSSSSNGNHTSPSVKVIGFGANDVNQTIGKIQEIVAVDDETSAGNCFEDYAGWDFFSFTEPTEEFTYYYKDSLGCKRRPLLVPTFPVSSQNPLDCASNIGSGINTGFKCFLRITSSEQISAKLIQLNSELASANDSLQHSIYHSVQWYKWRLKIIQVKNCIKNLKKLFIKNYSTERRFNELINFASNESFEIKSLVATQLLNAAEFTIASSYLSTISSGSVEEDDYVTSQYHLLNKLMDGNYQLDNVSKNNLYLAAQKLNPLSAYSRSVYSFITGEYLDFHLEEESEAGLRNYKERLSNTRIFPNPFKDQITVENLKEAVHYNIVNIEGIVIKRGSLSDDNQIPTFDLMNGVYCIIIRDINGTIIEIRKLLKL